MNEKMNVFLLIGQSNMAGRGLMDEVQTLHDQRVLMFRDGRWMVAEEPLHTDRPTMAGVGLGMSFAVELLAKGHAAPIGLVPCAEGGTKLCQWMPGDELYETAVSTARAALAEGTLNGILWHQGEGDSEDPEYANTYAERLKGMLTQMRADLNAEDVPIIAGELGPFLKLHPPSKYFTVVNEQIRSLEKDLPHYTCVSADGLSAKPDNVHFDSKALREFGLRYAAKYLSMKSTTNKRSA